MTLYNFVIKVFRVFSKVFFKYEVIGLENIPNEGNLVIAANHKSNLDPIFVAAAVSNRKMTAIAKEELFKNKLLGAFLSKLEIIPINRTKPSLSSIKTILKYIKKGYAVGIFPEGTRHKEEGFSDAKAGLSLFAIKGKALVVPCTIVSDYKLFKRATVYFGEPISLEEYYNQKLSSKDHEKIANEIMEVIKDNYYKISEGR